MAQQQRNRRPTPSTTTESAVVEGILGGIVAFVKWVIDQFKTEPAANGGISRAQIQEGWEQVELRILQPGTAALAVSDADKLLDAAFRLKRVAGSTMGERLKNAKTLFPHDLYQDVWEAHKLRNTLAHEIGSSASSGQAKAAVASFRKAMYQLGVL